MEAQYKMLMALCYVLKIILTVQGKQLSYTLGLIPYRGDLIGEQAK